MFSIGKGEEEIKQLSYNYDIEQEAKLMKELNSLNVSSVSEKMLKDDSKSFTNEFNLLMLRSYIHNYRYPLFMIFRLAFQIFLTVFVSSFFLDVDVQYREPFVKAGCIFNISIFEMMITYYSGLFCIICERDILRKEYQNKTYGLAAVYASKAAFELPIMLTLGFIL